MKVVVQTVQQSTRPRITHGTLWDAFQPSSPVPNRPVSLDNTSLPLHIDTTPQKHNIHSYGLPQIATGLLHSSQGHIVHEIPFPLRYCISKLPSAFLESSPALQSCLEGSFAAFVIVLMLSWALEGPFRRRFPHWGADECACNAH